MRFSRATHSSTLSPGLTAASSGAMPAMEIDYGLAPAEKAASLSWTDRVHQAAAVTPWLGRGCPCCIGW